VATIKQVAERAGVSPATVSRVLTGRTAVDGRKRDLVLRAVAELNYRPNLLASNLRRQKTAKIGVVVPDIENPHFSQSIRVFEEIAYREGFRVLLCNTEDQPAKQQAYLEVLADERVEGILLVPYDSDGPEIAAVIDRGIPLLAYDRPVDDPRADTAALRQRGLEPYVAPGEFNVDRAREATAALLAHPDGITGLVVGSNRMTVGAWRAIRACGVRVPDELAVVGIDDPWWAELLEPPMTTVAQPVRRMAEAAVDLLFERIAGTRSHPRCVVYGFELRVRQSCGTNGAD
jgi:DNA-binding LacI/PurR family transcriptional regulator